MWNVFKNDSSPLLGCVSVSSDEASAVASLVESKLKPEQILLISDVLDEYEPKDSYTLECLTHEEEPWVSARGLIHPASRSSTILSKEVMKRYFKEKLYGKASGSEEP